MGNEQRARARTMTRERYLGAGRWEEVTEPVVVVAGVAFPAGVVASLGADHLEHVARQPNPGAYCQARARGWWDANDLEYVGLYATAAACFSDEQTPTVTP